jgi:hypothetical protein
LPLAKVKRRLDVNLTKGSKMKQLLFVVSFLLCQSAYSFELTKEYKALGIHLGVKTSVEKVCGRKSKSLSSMPSSDSSEVIDCQSTQLKVESMVVNQTGGVPLQVSADYEPGDAIEPLKPGVAMILEDEKDSTGMRTIKGILPTDLKKKISAANLSAFLLSVVDDKVTSLTVTDCANDFAEKRAKGQFDSCQKGREKIK